MTADIELLPLEYLRTLPAHCRGRIDAYARANVEHHTAPLQAEIEALLSDLADYMRIANTEAARADRLEEALEFQSALTKSLLPYQDEAVASRAEIKALKVDVEAWKASHSMLTDTCHHFQARAKRLAEALRHQRWCRTSAEDGWESCEEGRKNDALLRDQEEGK